jgi:hypothetical protein
VPVDGAFLLSKFWKKFFKFVLSVPAVLFPLCMGGLSWVLMLGGVVLFTFGIALISSYNLKNKNNLLIKKLTLND